MNDYPNFAPDDSGAPSQNIPFDFPVFTSPMIERWNQIQREKNANPEQRTMGIDEIATEVLNKLMDIACDPKAKQADKVAALEANWRVYADYARLKNGD